MAVETKKSALNRLQALAQDMKKAYPKVTEKAQSAIKPLEEVIAEIDETFRPAHLPELVLANGSTAEASSACFAKDTLTDGSETEYLLCVARGPDSKCHIHVSSCKYDLKALQAVDKERLEAAIQNASLQEFKDIPVRLKAKSIAALDGFAEAYEAHILAVRQSLLDGTPVEGPQETSTPLSTIETSAPVEESAISEPTPEEDPIEDEAPEAKEESEPASEPEVPQVDTDANTDVQDPLVEEIEENARDLSAASAALDLPAEQWIPSGH